MSYRNPKQVVDTQSGQHIRNMMKTVTESAVNVIKTRQAALEKRQKENIEFKTKTVQAQSRVANSANAANVSNSGTDWASSIKKGITRYGDLYLKSLRNPTEFTTDEQMEMSALANMGTQIKQQAVEDQADFEELNEAFKAGPGQYGGFGLFTNTKVLKRLAIQGKMGSVVGSSKGEFAWDPKVGGLITKVVSYDEGGAVVGTNANGGNMADYVVPNPTKNMMSIREAIELKNEDYFKDQEIKSKYNADTKITIKSQFENKEALLADIRSKSDGYIEGLGANAAIRLYNNKMRKYVKEDFKKIIDPDKSQWDINEQGDIIDPQLEKIKALYAEMLADEMGLGKNEKIVSQVKDPKPSDVIEKTSFQKAIDGLASKIKVSAKDTWVLKGEGDDRYYELPPPRDSKNMDIGKAQTVNVFLFDEGGKKIGKNWLGMRSQMVSVKDN
tara:strand:+ start:1174 stop:2502 length:1329 start_codon:yes stop_codon:yes gene_type:complete